MPKGAGLTTEPQISSSSFVVRRVDPLVLGPPRMCHVVSRVSGEFILDFGFWMFRDVSVTRKTARKSKTATNDLTRWTRNR